MKRVFSVLAVSTVVFLVSLLTSCSKDDPKTAPGDKNDIFRDWTKKGKRTPAPPPDQVLFKDKK